MFQSLRIRLAAILLSLTIVPLGLVAWIIGYNSSVNLADQSLALQQAVTARIGDDIVNFVEQQVNELTLLDAIVDLAHRDLAEQKDHLGQFLMHDRVYQELALLDAAGRERIRLSRTNVYPQGRLRDRSADPEFVSPARDRRTYFGRMQIDPVTREPLFTIAVPLVELSSNALANVLVAEVRFKHVWDLLAAAQFPQSLDVYVLDRDGGIVAHRNPALVLGAKRLAMPDHHGAGVTASGERVIVAKRELVFGDETLTVVAMQSRSDALQLVATNIWLTFAVTVVTVAVAGLLGLWLTRQTARPIEALAGAARRISGGDLSARIEPVGRGEIRDLSVAFTEMTTRLRASIEILEHAKFVEQEKAQVTLESIGDAVITTNASGTVEYLNPIAQTLTGWPLEEAKDLPIAEVFRIVNEYTGEAAEDVVARCIMKNEIVTLTDEAVLLSRDQREYAIQASASPIRGHDGNILGVVLVFSNVTQARRLQREVLHQASHDPLTGLVNRREFEIRLKRVLDSSRTDQSEHVLCYLDLDQFKLINDTCGHQAGDEMLRQITAIFLKSVRRRDTLGRLGGDEFAVLMEHCTPEQALRVAHDLREAIEDFRFVWNGQPFSVGVSVGVVSITGASESVTSVLRAADTACYVAKKSGRNRVHLYREGDANLSPRQTEMGWAARISQALEHDRFFLVAQPIVPVGPAGRGRPHYELLLRLIDENDRVVPPGAFLPAAERYNLATRIDRWVARAAFTWLKQRADEAKGSLWSINLSGQSMADESFLAYVHQQLEDKGVAPEWICFEITEAAVIANIGVATAFISALRERGCRFALDDFRSALSSFAYLKSLPVDFLKIDGAFVKDIENDLLDRAIVRSIHEAGRLMGVKTIAECVEEDAILQRLREIGVDYAQGYGMGKPRPLAEIWKDPVGEGGRGI